MSRFLYSALLVVILSGAGLGQDGLSSSGPKLQRVTDTTPVTCAEADAVFQRIEDAMGKLFPTVHGGAPGVSGGDSALTREKVVDEFDRVSKLYAAQYTLKPREQYCDESAVRLPKKQRAEAIRLIKLGFMEPVAELEVGPADSLTIQDFSEALGFFVERWADMTHLPSIKFSPGLMPDGSKPTPPAGSLGRAPSGASPPQASE